MAGIRYLWHERDGRRRRALELVELPGPSPNAPRVQSTEAVGEDEGEVKAERRQADAVESAVRRRRRRQRLRERVVLSGASSDVDANGAISTASEARAAPTTSYEAAPEHESSLYPAEELYSTSRREGSPSGTLMAASEGVERGPRIYTSLLYTFALVLLSAVIDEPAFSLV